MKKVILGFVIGAILFGGIGISLAVQSNIASSDIAYTNSKNANVTSVKQAVDDLYGKVKDTAALAAELDKYHSVTPQFVKSCETSNYLTCKVINQFKSNNVDYGVYYHNGSITGKTAGIDSTTDILDAEDYSFRYAGADGSINNYVCFGSSSAICPADNLYRIIGAFTFDIGSTYHIKLIKKTAFVTTVWDSTYYLNTWMRPADVRTTLNQTTSGGYLYTLGTNWQNLIYQPIWKVGGDDYNKIYTSVSVKASYTNEMASLGGSNKPTTGDTDASGAYVDTESKIGLMYVSDYGYAASPKYWKTEVTIYGDTAKNYDWLFLNGSYQWTISRRGDTTDGVHIVSRTGYVYDSNARNTSAAVRPTFYLNSNVEVSSGTGTSSDPWRIKI